MERLNRMLWLAEAIPTQQISNNQGARSTTEAGAVEHAPPRMDLKYDGHENIFSDVVPATKSWKSVCARDDQRCTAQNCSETCQLPHQTKSGNITWEGWDLP